MKTDWNTWHGLLLVILLVLPSISCAEALPTLIDRLQQAYDRTKALTADFVQVATLHSLNRHQTSSGRVFIAKPASIKWEYTQPNPQTILYNGTDLRIYTPNRQQLLQSPINSQDRGNVALLFLAGVVKLRETFNIEMIPLEGSDAHQLSLIPRSSQASFKELRIIVNPTSFLVEKLSIYDTIGNITNIHLYSLKQHERLPPETFHLTIPPDTEILTPKDFSGTR